MRLCVYTSIFGAYDALLEPPEDDRVDYVCFTDDPELRSDRWETRVVPPAFLADPIRSARMVKILGHESLEAYDLTLYVDASVRLRGLPSDLARAWMTADVDVALPLHSFRETLWEEFDEVSLLKYDDPSRVYEQLVHYSREHPDLLEAKPLWTAVLLRRNTPVVRSAMRVWADHVLRYSRRDQLSVLVALTQAGIRFRGIDIDNFSSEHHEWPVVGGRDLRRGKVAAVPQGPLLADLHRSGKRIDQLERQVVAAADVHSRADRLEAERNDLAAERNDLAERLRIAQAELDTVGRRVVTLEGEVYRVRSIREAASDLRRGITRRVRALSNAPRPDGEH